MSLPARVATLVVAFLAVVAGVCVRRHPLPAGRPADGGLHRRRDPEHRAQVNIVHAGGRAEHGAATAGLGVLLHQEPETGKWVHTTLFKVPAGTRVNMTILGYDGCTPLRNPYWGMVTGTIGNIALRQRQAGLGDQLLVGLQRRAHVLDPRHQPERADGLAGADREPVRHVAVHLGPAQTMTFSFMTPQAAGRLLLAVPGPLRRRLRRRIWRSHADDRLHDRQHGRWCPDGRAEAPPRPPAAPPDGPANHGLRIFLIWLSCRAHRRPAHLVRLGPAPAAGHDVVVRGQASSSTSR